MGFLVRETHALGLFCLAVSNGPASWVISESGEHVFGDRRDREKEGRLMFVVKVGGNKDKMKVNDEGLGNLSSMRSQGRILILYLV